jgi:hypothetical protein
VPSVIKTVTWDCADALVLAHFWAAALGSDVDEDSTQAKAYVEAAGWGCSQHVVQPGSRAEDR